jgi:hypothetical protein
MSPQAHTTSAESLLQFKPLIEQYLKKIPQLLSVYSFISIFSWKDFFQFEIKKIEKCLCVFARHDVGMFLYLPPLGETITPHVIEECFKQMNAVNKNRRVSRIENVALEQLQFFPEKQFSIYKKSDDYCYQKEDIAGLRGNFYKSKRSSYNQFVSQYQYQFKPLNSSMIDECMKLYDRWAEKGRVKEKDGVGQWMLEENRIVHESVLAHYKELGAVARVVTVDGRIQAYTLGYPVNETVFCILFEVADVSFKGLPVFIFSQFCRDEALQAYSLINVMDDFGLDAVRRTKESFHPYARVASHTVTMKEIST